MREFRESVLSVIPAETEGEPDAERLTRGEAVSKQAE